MSKQTVFTNRLSEIESEVGQHLDSVQDSYLKVGSLLLEAKEEFEKYADFIDWCKLSFAIGKAQVSKLMRISRTFGEDERFKGVSMRVMYALAANANDDQIDKAAEFAANGTLNTAVVNQLLNPEPVAPNAPEAKQEVTKEEAEKAEAEAQAALDNVPAATAAPEAAPAPADSSELAELRQTITELREALTAAQAVIAEQKNEKVKHNTGRAAAPMLPQFKSKTAYAVLGLAAEQADKPTAVKKAYREFIKLGYGEGHEAFENLTAARDKLLSAIK